ITRMYQAFTQPRRTMDTTTVVARPPGIRRAATINHRRIIDQTGGGKTIGQRSGINEWLDGGAGLPVRLHRTIEFGATEIKPADQRLDRAVARIQGHQCALSPGYLGQFPWAVGAIISNQPNHIATLDQLRRRAVLAQPGIVVAIDGDLAMRAGL